MTSDWADAALCLGMSDADEVFFGRRGNAAALPICAACVVRVECLDAALVEESGLSNREHIHGVRGGLLPRERARLLGYR